jgi:gliding motility-associated-like protein
MPGEQIKDSIVNNTNHYKKVRYAVIPYIIDKKGLEICTGIPDTFEIIVNPTPIILVNISKNILCDSSDITFNLYSPTIATGQVKYTLSTSFMAGSVSGVQTIGNYSINDFTNHLVNNTLQYQKITYQFTPYIENYRFEKNCNNYPIVVIDIYLNPTPQLTVTTDDTLYCNNSNIKLNINNINGNILGNKEYYLETIYDTSKIQVSGILKGYYSINLINQDITNQTEQMQTVKYRLTPVFRNPSGNDINELCSKGKIIELVRYILPSIKLQLTPKTFAGGWNEPCKGDSLGEIKVLIKGGMKVLGMPSNSGTYQWKRNSISWITTHDTLIHNLPIGNYYLQATDTHGCQGNSSITLNEPTLLEVSTKVVSKIECTGTSSGKIVAIPTGGTSDYSFVWTFGPTKIVSNTDTVFNCVFGTYHVTVTDQNHCEARAIQIFDPGDAFLLFYTNPLYYGYYNISCPGASDGGFEPTKFASDTIRYYYEWAKIENDTPVWTQTIANGNIYNLPKGVYRLTVTNSLGCYGVVIDTLKEPSKVKINATIFTPYNDSINLTCHDSHDGKIQINPSGGHGNYKYLWQSNQLNQNLSIKDLDSLEAGIYYLTVMDTSIRYTDLAILTNTCYYNDTFKLIKPDSLKVQFNFSNYHGYNVSCYNYSDGNVHTIATGGKGTLSYQWLDSSNTSLSQTANLINAKAGSYNLKIRYGKSCNYTYNIHLTQPDSIKNNPQISQYGNYNISCYNGKNGYIFPHISGGVAPYGYQWYKNGTFFNNKINIDSLSIGQYRLKVTDNNNCNSSWTYNLIQAPLINIYLQSNRISCFGQNDGEIRIKAVNGGVAPYSYYCNTLQKLVSDTIKNLSKGTYTIEITDSLNCKAIASIDVKEPDKLEAEISFDTLYNGREISCYGANNARIKAIIKGGTLPYLYKWQDEFGETNRFSQNSIFQQNLSVGDYYLTVIDSSNCKATTNITISQPDSLWITIQTRDLLCYNDNSGMAMAIAKGGTRPYTYLWSGYVSDSLINNLSAGNYNVIVKDINGCLARADAVIQQPSPLTSNYKINKKPYCPSTFDGEISISAGGGTNPYSYLWENGTSGNILSEIKAGEYIYTITDKNNCSLIDTVKLSPQTNECLDIPKAFSPNGDGINDTWNILVGDPTNPVPLSVLYPKAIIEIYNRWGVLVYRSEKGYTKEWDGRSKFKELPMDSYYYTIDLGNGENKILGIVSIIR